jgi:membrane protease YdiL (CAAX protease family)
MLLRPGDYHPQQALAAPAMASAALWRLGIGVVVLVVTYAALMLFTAGALVSVLGDAGRAMLNAGRTGETPLALTALLFTFAFMTGGLAVALWFLHRRGLAGLIGPPDQALRDFRRVAAALIALSLLFLPLTLMSPDVGRQMTLLQQLPYWPLGLTGLLLQTATEELVFRGYLQSQLAARFRSPLVWIGLPSLLFGLTHYNPEMYGSNAWAIVAWAVVFGLLAADLTARTGSLGAAIGMHFATNFSAIFLVGAYGHLDGLALYNVVVDLKDPALMGPLLGVDLLGLLVTWLLARVVLRR